LKKAEKSQTLDDLFPILPRAGMADLLLLQEKSRSWEQLADLRMMSENGVRASIFRLQKALALEPDLVEETKAGQVKLTDAGEAIAEAALAIRAAYDAAFALADRIGQGPNTVIVACFSVHIERLLAKALKDMPDDLKHLEVTFREARSTDRKSAIESLFEKLGNDEVDLAVGGPRFEQRGFGGDPLYSDKIVAMLHSEHDLKRKYAARSGAGSRQTSGLPVAELEGRHLLLPPRGFFSRNVIDKVLAVAKVTPSKVTELFGPHALFALGEVTDGIPLFATDAHLPHPARGTPFPVLLDAKGVEVGIDVYVHYRRRLKARNPQAWRFREYLLKHARKSRRA
jgi:DNA-binding transcriptional LysR family regulator